jgi:cell division protein FtsN
MEIFYCDVCGLRLSAAESEAAQRGGEEAKPLCAKCRARILPPTARKVSGAHLAPATVSSRKLLPAQRQASSRREPEQPSGHRKSSSRIGVYILVGVLAGAVGAVFALSSRNAAPAPTVELTASPPRKAEPEPPPDAQRQNAEPKPSPTEQPQPSKPSATTTTAIEKAAQEEFEQLCRFAGIGAEDWNGRAARVETFLQRYGETVVGARARVLLREFQGRLTEAQPAVAVVMPPPPVAPPPIETKPSDSGEPDAFAIATGSAAFQDEILELMRKRDLTAAAARLKRAEADPLLKQSWVAD